jgi:hypothetical protein
VSTDQVERSLILVILILYNKIKTFTKICLFVNQKIVEANGWILIILKEHGRDKAAEYKNFPSY